MGIFNCIEAIYAIIFGSRDSHTEISDTIAPTHTTNMKNATHLGYLTCLLLAAPGQAASVVTPETTQLADPGTSGSPAQWILGDHFTSATAFIVGGNWNQLSIDSDYNFEAQAGFSVGTSAGSDNSTTIMNGSSLNVTGTLVVGPVRSGRNILSVTTGATVNVTGNVQSGLGSISYYSTGNLIDISGVGATLATSGDLDLLSGYNATNNTLRLTQGGMAIVDSDKNGTGAFSLYNHWSYGNCWMELDDSSHLAIWGDNTAQFAEGQGILTSIKVWDVDSNSFQKVSTFVGQTVTPTPFLNDLSVDYITDSSAAAAAGVGDEFIGFTIVHAIPEPTLSSMLAFGLLLGCRRRR